ncbi:MAG: hypothetical protein IJD92_00255 [Bacilli bacterium]|nr:hypothetical protein [Bacilli bacterium]
MIESILILFLAIFALVSRFGKNDSVGDTVKSKLKNTLSKIMPYNYEDVKKKAKELGQSFSAKQYIFQFILFLLGGGGVAFLYFRSLSWAIIYGFLATTFIPYLSILKYNRIYSEYLFECIQTYCTNVIMEFNTTQSFVKSLEGVIESGVLEEPVLGDVKTMVDMAYKNGTIDESINWFNKKYPYYMVKNMHQLFLQITNEGAKDSGESLENMMSDIDALVEGVYRDKMDRKQFYNKFLTFGLSLYLLVMLIQFLLNSSTYIAMLEYWYVQVILHLIIIVNSFFLVSGIKFYNEDTGVE